MDGFRCKHCRHYVSIYPEDVDVHWDDHEHGVREVYNAEESTAEEMRAVLRGYYMENEEYQKINLH